MKVHELLATPDKWIQFDLAKDANGESVRERSEAATCWCLYGALIRVYDFPYRVDIAERIDRFVGGSGLIGWNNAPERTHAEVLALCKELDI